ncbi:hypothetical protein BASA83_011683 [Batrachochytrium salamandrivorans]|nr:hypothetical protein BASA81_013727 [Batrachochytrium salamandrivorans]KAH9264783.1 hypothetical protein BASA83_011683 [Batrachochytrium salamandrivorans]
MPSGSSWFVVAAKLQHQKKQHLHQPTSSVQVMPGVEYGVGPPAGDNIWLAAGDGRTEDVEYFLKAGGFGDTPMDVNSKDQYGYTGLHAAASYNHLDLVRMLIKEYGADPNITDFEGDAPLHVIETSDAGRLLIELGADPTLRNDAGALPIECAFTEGWTDVVEYLSAFTPDFERNVDDSLSTGDNAVDDSENEIDMDELPEEMRVHLMEQLAAFQRDGLPIEIDGEEDGDATPVVTQRADLDEWEKDE